MLSSKAGLARSRALPRERQRAGAGWEARAASRMLPGLRQRVYACVHGGEVQGVCTARAGRAPLLAPDAAANKTSAAG